jgi:hypothetical protein
MITTLVLLYVKLKYPDGGVYIGNVLGLIFLDLILAQLLLVIIIIALGKFFGG